MRHFGLWISLLLLMSAPGAWAAEATDPSTRPALRTAPVEPPPPPYASRWDGNATGFVVGPAWTRLDRALPGIDRTGLGLRVAGRMSFVMQFVDFEVFLEHARHGGAALAGGGSTGGGLSRTDLGGQMAVHPGFPLTVFNDFWSDVFAGVHGYAGLSMVRAALDGEPAVAAAGGTGSSQVDWRPSVHVGAGVDVPLTARGQDHGWWLTLRYDLRWMNFGDFNPDLSLADSKVMVLLGYRSYSTSWAHVPRPF